MATATSSGSRAYTTAVYALAQAEAQGFKMAVKIDTSSPLYYCTGSHPVVLDAQRYEPERILQVVDLPMVKPNGASVRLDLADEDNTLVTTVRNEGLTDQTVTLTALLLDGTTWTKVYTWSGLCTGCYGSGGTVTMTISGTGGLKTRAALSVGTRGCPHWYKGANCQYASSVATCRRTFDDCEDNHGGTSQSRYYGGLRYAPEPGEVISIREVRWTVPVPSDPDPKPQDMGINLDPGPFLRFGWRRFLKTDAVHVGAKGGPGVCQGGGQTTS